MLRAATTWDAPSHAALLEGAAAALAARVAFPAEALLASWDAVALEEYVEFREAFLGPAVAEIDRQRPAAFAAHAVQVLGAGGGALEGGAAVGGGAAGGGSWQRREAALFAATASVEGRL